MTAVENPGEAVSRVIVCQDGGEDEVILLNPIKEGKVSDIQVARAARWAL